MPHFHIFQYAGRAYSDAEQRRGQAPAMYPPIEIKDWLKRPAAHIVRTLGSPEEALGWLVEAHEVYPPVDGHSFTVEARARYWQERLSLPYNNDVVLGYYSGGRYVALAAIGCWAQGERVDPRAAARPGCPQPAGVG